MQITPTRTLPILCTLFDQNYLVKGLAFIQSLRAHYAASASTLRSESAQQDFRLFVLTLDETTRIAIEALQDERIACFNLAALDEAESTSLSDRSRAEMAWTLTPLWTRYVMRTFGVDHVAYMDADSFLFARLDALYAEIGSASVAIIPHRFPPRLAWRERENGIYNVNFCYFRQDQVGERALDEWSAECLEWCYQRSERDVHGKLRFGDQAYLDEWTDKYNAHVIQHLGANLAPWNQEGYRYTFEQQLFIIKYRELTVPDERGSGKEGTPIERIDRLLFYHFHEHDMARLVNAARQIPYRGGYPLKDEVIEHVYVPYERECRAIEQSLARA